MEMNQSKIVTPKIRGHKLRNGVNWQGALKQKGVKQRDVKQCLDVFPIPAVSQNLQNSGIIPT
jgi:hypothetical protein